MALKRELFINAIQMVDVDGRREIPSVMLFDKTGSYFGYQAFEKAEDGTDLNENFKLNLGESAPSRLDPPKFDTGDGTPRSAYEITRSFIEGVLRSVQPQIKARGFSPAKRVLVAEPLALDRSDTSESDWLANYRAKLKRILGPYFEEVDFLPEPFAVFQYYRYGMRHPLLATNTRHSVLVVDFGGGTFDVSVVDTTATGDVSGGGKNSRPLAAASVPVGGSYINIQIARDLIARNLEKGVDKGKLAKAWDEYKNGADVSGNYQVLRDDYRQFIRNARRVVTQVEKAKLHICDTLADWSLDAALEPGPAMQILVPRNPFSKNPEEIPVRFDANQLRKIFVDNIWNSRLKAVVREALARSHVELKGRPIELVLLSGGSANIRWLARLVQELLSDRYPEAEILEMQSSFQEVVSKGLAIECARRTFNQGDSDFKAVTYNRLCLVLGADGGAPGAVRFRSLGDEKNDTALSDGTLIESAHWMGAADGDPMRWKFRLPSPPKHHLDYYFLKSSLDFDDIRSRHNITHRVVTPRNTQFDSSILLELTVSEDGTAHPKFTYRRGKDVSETIAVDGAPFFLDMTYGGKTTVGEAYIGVDFGTSNSSVSYVDRNAISVFSERASDRRWRELNDLVAVLPYPAANSVAKFIGAPTERDVKEMFPAAFESLLFTLLTIAYADYRTTPEAEKSKIFRQFDKGSAGPIWATLRTLLEKKVKGTNFHSKLHQILDVDAKKEIDYAIDAINDHKHHRVSTYAGHRDVLALLGNLLCGALEGWRFGQFEEVKKRGFGSRYTGIFRATHGAHAPFVELYEYSGKESFSDMEALIVSPEKKVALRLSPLMFWTQIDSRGENSLAVIDRISEKFSEYRVISSGDSVSLDSNSELSDLHVMCTEISKADTAVGEVCCADIHLSLR